MEWKICRARRGGTLDSAVDVAAKEARSRRDHSHSRFWRNAKFDGNVSLLSVVSIWKIFTPGFGDETAHAPVRRVQLGGRLVHERLRVAHGLRVVVVAQAAVAGQAGGDALVTAVHGDQVDVDVDEQVRGGRPLVDLHLLALVGLADEEQVVGVFGVVLGQQAVGGEGVVDPVTEGVAQLVLGHAAVQSQCGNELDVVDAGLRRHVEHGLDHHLADVGRLHGRQRQRDVVEADGELHARPEQRRQRVAVALGVEQARGGWPGRGPRSPSWARGRTSTRLPSGSVSRREALAAPEQGRWRRLVHLEDEAWTATHRIGPFRTSNAILTAPRRPAEPAWATASSKRASG